MAASNSTEESQGMGSGSPRGPEGMPYSRKRSWVWWLLLLVILAVWFFWRPPAEERAALDETPADYADAVDPDDILVDLHDDVSDADVAALERDFGIDLVLVSDQSLDERFYRAHVPAERQAQILADLAKRPGVSVAEPDSYVSLIPQRAWPAPDDEAAWKGFPDDPMYKHQWHMEQIHMPAAWRLAGGDDVVVAVIDTGVAFEDFETFHRVPDLETTEFVKGYDFIGNDAHANDDHGHGTHVAGTIAQTTHNKVGVAGVAPRAKIMPLKVLSKSGSGSVAGIADAIRYAADNGAHVINMSLGGPFPSKVLGDAVKYAHDKGVTVVCAAGNDGRGRVGYPAKYDGSIAVAATQFDETTTFYSNWGKEIDIAAPGGNTRVDQNNDGMPDGVLQNTIVVGDPTADGYFPFMGTSMASPHVAGVAALIVSQGVKDPKAVERILQDTARKPSSKGSAAGKSKVPFAHRYGAGIVDAEAAVTKARAGTGGWQLGLAFVLALAVAGTAGRRGLAVSPGAGYITGVIFGSAGLLFVPLVLLQAFGLGFGQFGGAGVLDMLARGFPSWDLSLVGPSGHGNPLFFSVLVPLGAVALGYGVTRFRGLLAGFAVGVAAHLGFHAVAGIIDIQMVPLDAVWLLANAALATVLAVLTLRR